ncbi:unnamed protein product [Ambrosiozyma monospora]|uniref:Unnamed protein product n=1 Tax=Ambrosiozyma monospora TaxID=43982 RepID=A0A9W6Z7B0_AMBMO|nr:unnamed protein product [Ambrosiozyma monospora]
MLKLTAMNPEQLDHQRKLNLTTSSKDFIENQDFTENSGQSSQLVPVSQSDLPLYGGAQHNSKVTTTGNGYSQNLMDNTVRPSGFTNPFSEYTEPKRHRSAPSSSQQYDPHQQQQQQPQIYSPQQFNYDQIQYQYSQPQQQQQQQQDGSSNYQVQYNQSFNYGAGNSYQHTNSQYMPPGTMYGQYQPQISPSLYNGGPNYINANVNPTVQVSQFTTSDASVLRKRYQGMSSLPGAPIRDSNINVSWWEEEKIPCYEVELNGVTRKT